MRTTACGRSRSDSGADSRWRPARAGTWSTSTPTTATVTLGDVEELARGHVDVDAVTYTDTTVAVGARVEVQVRAHGPARPGTWRGDRVVWDVPQPRVAPGQTVALYAGDRVLGAGIAA